MAKRDTVVVEGDKYTLEDMKDWFIQIRGFPTILRMGKHMGEGQSGGRAITELAHKVENAFVKKYGEDKYKAKMSKLMEVI